MIFAKDLGAPETPRLLPKAEAWLCVEMAIERGCVTKISLDGTQITRIAKTGRPNGLTVDKEYRIWVAETYPTPSLVKVLLDGSVEVVATGAEEKFLLPNDLCFGPDGALYMTDSGILLEDWAPGGVLRADWKNAKFDGRVYKVELHNMRIVKLDSGLQFANGIAIGPDQKLYVNEMITGNVYKYEIEGDKVVEKKLFGNVLDPTWEGEGFRGPDGMAFGQNGDLYCTVFGEGQIAILDKEGRVKGRLRTDGIYPTNVAFGPNDEKKIYVTEAQKGQIEVYEVDTSGLPLYY